MDEGESETVGGQFVVSRFTVDPATPLGQLFLREPETERDRQLVDGLGQIFDATACWADVSFAMRIDAERTGVRGAGMASLLLVTPAEMGDLCAADRVALLQPSSFREGTEEPIVSGPLFIEGQTLEARMSLGDVGMIVFDEAQLLPRWWSFRAQFAPLPGSRASISDAEVSTTWSVRQHLQGTVPSAPELRYIDELVRLGFEPDLDVDGDGLERMEAGRDGRIMRCIDGPGAPEPRVIEGDDCMLDPRIADGYLLQLRFQLYPVRLRE
ncbi:MAG: hypothetical protein AB8I08_17700 [Sandaracinaceae bacterium]